MRQIIAEWKASCLMSALDGWSVLASLKADAEHAKSAQRMVDEIMAERLAVFARGEPATLRTTGVDGVRTTETIYRPAAGGVRAGRRCR